jgi:hypothetical protein
MSDDAKEVTYFVGAEGNVWSETRLKRREVMTRMRVTMFSGASTNARRTWKHALSNAIKEAEKRLSQLTVLG